MSRLIQRTTAVIKARASSVLVVLVVILLYSLLPIAKTQSQEQNRIIEKWPAYSSEPLSITTIRNLRGIVEFGKTFSADDDWFKELTVSVKNVSGKDITYIDIGLRFIRPENQAKEPPLVHTISHGDRLSALKRIAPPIDFKSSSEDSGIDIKLPDHAYKSIKLMLENLGYPPNIKRINIYIENVLFSDGTAWASGTWFKRNPIDPEKLIPIEQSQVTTPQRTSKTPMGGGLNKSFRETTRLFFETSHGKTQSPVQNDCGQPQHEYYASCNIAGLRCSYRVEEVVTDPNVPAHLRTHRMLPVVRGCVVMSGPHTG